MAVVVSSEPILYVCPYCVRGRFTGRDGWGTAIKHIREQHQDGKRTSPRRGRPGRKSLADEEQEILEEAVFG